MSLDSPAFTSYVEVPTNELHRREAVELHVPRAERNKPEMRRFIEGFDDRSRPHLMATAQAIARAELRIHESYQARIKLAERMYKVWAFIIYWSTADNRSLTWDRPRRKKGKRSIKEWRVWANQGDDTVAMASGRDPYETAEELAEKLGLL